MGHNTVETEVVHHRSEFGGYTVVSEENYFRENRSYRLPLCSIRISSKLLFRLRI